MLHLLSAGYIEGFIPECTNAVGALSSRLMHLNDSVLSIGVTARARENRPPCVSSNIGSIPIRLLGIVQPCGRFSYDGSPSNVGLIGVSA